MPFDRDYFIDGRKVRLKIEKGAEENGLAAQIDDRIFHLAAFVDGDHEIVMRFGEKNIVAFVVRQENAIVVHIAGKLFALESETGKRKLKRQAGEFNTANEVVTPMPGKIVKILVAAGDPVTARQPLVIVESMKMENEIRSPINGTVGSINFAEGDLVQPGQSIIDLKPSSAES